MNRPSRKTWDNLRWLMLVVVLGLPVLLGADCDTHKPPSVVRYGELRLLAQIPNGGRRRTAAVEVTVHTPDGKEEVHESMPWAAADELRLTEGTKDITIETYDASGSLVNHASREVEVVEGQTTDLSITEWQTEGPEGTSGLGVLACIAALSLALALGGARVSSLTVLLLDRRWIVLPIALVAGFTFATVVTFFWQGTTFLASAALPSLWLLLIPTLVAYSALLELRFAVISIVPLDSLVAAASIGIACGIGSLGLPMIHTNGFPVLTWLGMGAVASIALQVYLHERL